MMQFPSDSLRLGSWPHKKTCPCQLGSLSYLVVEEGVGAKAEPVEGAEEGPPQQVGLEPAGPGQRVACPHPTL